MRAWSLYTTSTRDAYAGHEGYDDELRSRYAYDSGVPNHAGPAPGDVIVLRDESGALGIAFLEHVHSKAGLKRRRHCPVCGTSQLDRRKTTSPRFRCTRGHTFESPDEREHAVQLYRAEYGTSFLPFTGFDSAELESVCLARSRQNAIRELGLDQILAKLRDHGVLPRFAVEGARPTTDQG
jgi:hypothetical protein